MGYMRYMGHMGHMGYMGYMGYGYVGYIGCMRYMGYVGYVGYWLYALYVYGYVGYVYVFPKTVDVPDLRKTDTKAIPLLIKKMPKWIHDRFWQVRGSPGVEWMIAVLGRMGIYGAHEI